MFYSRKSEAFRVLLLLLKTALTFKPAPFYLWLRLPSPRHCSGNTGRFVGWFFYTGYGICDTGINPGHAHKVTGMMTRRQEVKKEEQKVFEENKRFELCV